MNLEELKLSDANENKSDFNPVSSFIEISPLDYEIDNSSRNVPKYLSHIARKVAEFRKESEELVFTAIYMNSLDFFDISV